MSEDQEGLLHPVDRRRGYDCEANDSLTLRDEVRNNPLRRLHCASIILVSYCHDELALRDVAVFSEEFREEAIHLLLELSQPSKRALICAMKYTHDKDVRKRAHELLSTLYPSQA